MSPANRTHLPNDKEHGFHSGKESSVENDGLVVVDENTVFQMKPDGLGQDHFLQMRQEADKVLVGLEEQFELLMVALLTERACINYTLVSLWLLNRLITLLSQPPTKTKQPLMNWHKYV